MYIKFRNYYVKTPHNIVCGVFSSENNINTLIKFVFFLEFGISSCKVVLAVVLNMA